MHYACYVITQQFPSDDAIGEMLEPFYEGRERDGETDIPPFEWDWWTVGGRYSGKLKLKFDANDDESKYRWGFYDKEPRAGRLFRSDTLESIKKQFLRNEPSWRFTEEEYYNSMGRRDGFLYVDGALIADLTNINEQAEKCYCIIDADGCGYARDSWNGKNFVKNEQFDELCRKIMSERKDCYITVVDIHD